MELSGRPLFDNPADAALFVEREEVARVERNCRDGVNTLVLGGRGTGKTSLIRNVLYRLRESDFPAVGVDGGPAESVSDLLELVGAALGRAPIDPPPGPEVLVLARLGDTGRVMHELQKLGRLGSPDLRTAVVVDLPAGDLEVHRLFGRFRDELWQLPLTWIVAAPDELRVDLMTPPADAFFEDVVKLGGLDAEQQEELVARRLGGERLPWRLPTEEEATPRRLLEIVRDSVRSGDAPESRMAARAEREAAIARLGRAASMLYAELSDFGPASASDERFLVRLGWSRQRAAKVLGELEEHGFVSSETRRVEGGRPRKVFVVEEGG